MHTFLHRYKFEKKKLYKKKAKMSSQNPKYTKMDIIQSLIFIYKI